MSTIREIHSDSLLDDIETHFRVLAGPGAGKTHWLTLNAKHVVRMSSRLSAVSRVACISYTNTAVNELIARLGEAAHHADVSTIHSFLYRNVVRPYLHLLTAQDGTPLVSFADVRGHDEHHPSQAKVRQWLKANGDARIIGIKPQFDSLLELLKSLAWARADDGSWSLAPLSPRGMGQFLKGICTSNKLIGYKTLYWREGTIDHDDVLYFAYRILEENPELRAFLAARFRYLFIDEFQDTMPIQAKIVEWLAAHGTVVGVIGDPEQAIYGFLKSTPEHFQNFSLPKHVDYRIADNRRSTVRIVDLLNHVRADGLEQRALRGVEGDPVTVYVGEMEKVIPEVRRSLPELASLWILARANNRVADIRRLDTPSGEGDLWDEFEESDGGRALFLKSVARAAVIARAHDLAKAVHTLTQTLVRRGTFREPLRFTGKVTEVLIRAVTLELLEHVVSNYDSLAGTTVLAAYDSIASRIESVTPGLKATRITTGKPKAFAESTNFGSLLATVSLTGDENRDVRSIHQAKGAEAENVCIYLPNAAQVTHILDPSSSGDDEERRITYVALSRARDRLVLCIPSEHANKGKLEDLGFQVRIVS